jgi:hypothetical protein
MVCLLLLSAGNVLWLVNPEKKRGRQSGAGECTKSWGIQLILDCTMPLVGSRLERRPNVIDQKNGEQKSMFLPTILSTIPK